MKKLTVPRLYFGKWHSWGNRKNISGYTFPGVYMIAITSKNLSGERVNFSDVSYIGMTNSQRGLQGRLSQFDRAIRGLRGHTGGNSINDKFGDYSGWPTHRKLYVCARSLEFSTNNPTPDDYINMGKVTYLEYAAFSRFCNRHPNKSKPEFNKR
jgi:hypothetical protein